MRKNVCPQCGAQLLSNDRFCAACGVAIKPKGQQRQGNPRRRSASRSRSQRSGKKGRRRQRRRSLTPGIIAVGGGVLLLLVALLLFLERGRPAPAADLPPDTHDEQGIPYPEVPRLALEEAKSRHDAGTAIFVDVRSQGEYETAHILNAVSLPLADFAAGYQTLPREAEIITYCT